MKYVASAQERTFNIELEKTGEIAVNEEHHLASIESIGGPSLYSLIVDNASYEVHVEERNGSYQVLLLGELYAIQVEDERTRRADRPRPKRAVEEGELAIKSPVPGLIFDVPVTPGQKVELGEILVIVEAMKMENELRAPREGVVQETLVAPGDSVNKGQVLVTIV
jgi:biotin carboxyl carrier protein